MNEVCGECRKIRVSASITLDEKSYVRLLFICPHLLMKYKIKHTFSENLLTLSSCYFSNVIIKTCSCTPISCFLLPIIQLPFIYFPLEEECWFPAHGAL